MRILSWNCRGLSRPIVVQTLRINLLISFAALNRLGFFLMSQVALLVLVVD
jgi:hypothetical protein